MLEPAFIQTDSRGRVLLPGHPNNRYLVQENDDGSILLQPATVVTVAQHEFQSTPELQDLLAGRLRRRLSVESVNAADEYQRRNGYSGQSWRMSSR
jgi:hypothetical protein